MRRFIRRNLAAGALALTPIAAVLWIVVWFWQILAGFIVLLPRSLQPGVLLQIDSQLGLRVLDIVTTFLLFALILVFVCVVGVISRNYLGNRILITISRILRKVPVLSTVYSTLEQLLKTFSTDQSKSFRKVVYVEYPRKGMYTLALVTGERTNNPMSEKKESLLTVYVPTTPNPTSGFYLTVSENEVKSVDMTVEEALKEIISMGIVQAGR